MKRLLLIAHCSILTAAAPASTPEMQLKCDALWRDFMPIIKAPVLKSFALQQASIAELLNNNGLISNDLIIDFVRVGISKAWWHFRNHQKPNIDKSWVRPEPLKPSVRYFLTKFDNEKAKYE